MPDEPVTAAPERAEPSSRDYVGEGIVVHWEPARCIHSAECIRALRRVFDTRRRPWVDVHAADADTIAAAVDRCPSGALAYTRTDRPPAAPRLPHAGPVELRTVADGPYLVTGPVRVVDAAGRVLHEGGGVALCRCGRTRWAPFCDGSHARR